MENKISLLGKRQVMEDNIADFWEKNPCGENLTGCLDGWSEHFKHYDAFRYSTEGHILGELDQLALDNKMVLEIGVGQAADSLQIAKRGATWNGLDLTGAAIMRAKTRFALSNQAYGEAKQGSALNIPWPDKYFDIIYSHGVLHHIPDIRIAEKEICRVLKPDGKLVIMLYHKNSLNYWISISFLRRLGLIIIYAMDRLGMRPVKADSVLGWHLQNARKIGLLSYIRMKNFIHTNTDGPLNPYSKVYTRKIASEDFTSFDITDSRCHFLNKRHLPGVSLLPRVLYEFLERRHGWHLWLFLKPRSVG